VNLLHSQNQALLGISEAIAVHRDLNELFHDLAQRLPRIVPFDFINLVLHDPTREVMRLHTLVAPESSTNCPSINLQQGWCGKVSNP
jgi:formate hydrogenlyase transcriptional activator